VEGVEKMALAVEAIGVAMEGEEEEEAADSMTGGWAEEAYLRENGGEVKRHRSESQALEGEGEDVEVAMTGATGAEAEAAGSPVISEGFSETQSRHLAWTELYPSQHLQETRVCRE
jgi:hypothetical protein